MGRPRKPTNVLDLKGAFKHDPARGRARSAEPTPEGDIGEAPEHLTEAEKACWTEIVDLCHRGTLCAADRLVVEHGARVLSALRAAPSYTDAKLMIRLEATLSRLGMTPADRSRVSVIKPPASADPMDEFARDLTR